MSTPLRLATGSFLLSLALLTLVIRPGVADEVRKVVMVMVDGARFSETFGDSTFAHIPRMGNSLRHQGTVYTRFYNDGATSTNSGHTAALTGRFEAVKNDGSQRPSRPTLFEYFRKQIPGTDTNQCQVVLGKDKLDILTHSSHKDYGPTYRARVRYANDPYDDVEAYTNLVAALEQDKPRLSVINLARTDQAGHEADWQGYLKAIRLTDSLVHDLWTRLQASPVYRDQTLLLVTNDHGRHTTDFVNHGDGCDGCKHIMLLMLGPGISEGHVDTTRHTLRDLPRTIGKWMGFETQFAEGKAIVFPAVPVSLGSARKELRGNAPHASKGKGTSVYGIPDLGRDWLGRRPQLPLRPMPPGITLPP